MNEAMDYEGRRIINHILNEKVFIRPVGNHHLGRHMVYVVTDGKNNPVIFKLYFKENRWNREVAALKLLSNSSVNVPRLIDYGVECGKEWIMLEFIEGNTFSSVEDQISVENQLHIFKEMGRELGKIHQYQFFDFFGDWDQNGNPLDYGVKYKDFFQKRLGAVIEKLFEKELPHRKLHEKGAKYIEENLYLIKNVNTPTLCHNDFDMRNVLVTKDNKVWNMAGIIDFEQSFPSDKDLDMAYLYYMISSKNKEYGKAFIEGYKEKNILKENFYIKMKFNLIYIGLYICSWSYDQAHDHYMQGVKILDELVR